MKNTPYSGEQLTDEQLNKLPTPRLLQLYKVKRSFTPSWAGADKPNYLSKSNEYTSRIKAVLNTREHVER
jgi:hypothetical protein